MSIIFKDENNTCQFDFSQSLWATDRLNTIYHDAKISLSDVDFLVETVDSLLFIEYKNAKFGDISHPEAFKPSDDKVINKVVRKYYDSMTYINAIHKGQDKKWIYVYILEYPSGDVVSRGYVRERLASKLPFLLQKQNDFNEKLIHDVVVLSVDEWNRNFPDFEAKILVPGT